MIQQTLKPRIKPYSKTEYRLETDFYYCCVKYGVTVSVPSGFIFDGASIPAFAQPTTGNRFGPRFIGPALIHDFGYRYAKDSMGQSIGRKKWDKVFLYALKRNGVSWWDRQKIGKALALFGGFAWRKHRKKD